MDTVTYLLELLGPTLVALLTVPTMSALKAVSSWVDHFPPWVQQMTVVLIAAGLSTLGRLLDMALPDTLGLFGENDVSALLSAGMALAIHAGKRARANAPPTL